MIWAELTGIRMASGAGVTVGNASAPVLALCRKLVAAGIDPATPMEVYRGEVLCLLVRSIGEGAGLFVDEVSGTGTPRFRKWVQPSKAGPQTAQNEF